jgi:SAM-dependent methyltransferase
MSPLAQIEQHLVTSLLSPEARAQYALGDIGKKELMPYVEALRGISSAYVSHTSGTRLSSPIDSAVAAAAYALYYTPINAAKILHFTELFHCRTEPLRVLDLGCGPGTAGLALLASLKNQLALTCVERSTPMRTLAKQLLSSFPSAKPLGELVIRETLEGIPQESFDIVIAANVFAELDDATAESTLGILARAVSTSGYLVLLEPGQLLHTRRLMALRDRVTTRYSGLTPIFPCLRGDTCPMLASSATDWCHGTLEWQQPPLHRQLDALLGFNKHRIKFSCFIFQEGAQLGDGVRVLTPPEKTRAGVEALICGEGIYGIGRIPKRLRSERTRAFEKAQVYDRLDCDPPFLGDAPDQVVIRNYSEL